MSVHSIAPALLFRGATALVEACKAIATIGSRALLVEGEAGAGRLDSRLDAALAAAGVRVERARHRGPCSDEAIGSIAEAAARTNAEIVVAVGGGRVIDASKAACHATGRPFGAMPTSPATCAAVTPLAVIYSPEGAYLSTRSTDRAPEVVALDPHVLAGAPDRLLVAGIADALAKVHEVRLTSRGAAERAATARAGLVLCDDLETMIHRLAPTAVAPTPPDPTAQEARREARALLAEACVLTPGLIGGLVGEDAKLAAAHPLHNALTHLPGSHNALHGELVGFGVLVQIALAGGDEEAVRREARLFRRLGLACHLAALGCLAAREEACAEVAARTVASAPMRTAFPGVSEAELVEVIRRVDAWARDEAEAALSSGTP